MPCEARAFSYFLGDTIDPTVGDMPGEGLSAQGRALRRGRHGIENLEPGMKTWTQSGCGAGDRSPKDQ
jgi:hypothetical protein